MTQQLGFSAAPMRASAASARGALTGISSTGFQRIDDCGSSLVAETVALFLEKLEGSDADADADAETRAKNLGDNIELTADDFFGAEGKSQASIQEFIAALDGLSEDE